MASSLEIDTVDKSFGTTQVLDGVSLRVEEGEFVSLVGPSGCGKSTLLRIIAGLESQDLGHVQIGGRTVDQLGPRARNIAMVFQSYALYPHLSAFANIALPLNMSRLTLAERLPLVGRLSPRRGRIMRDIAESVNEVAAQLQIQPLLGRKPGQLSGGQRQRVALARAMVREPSLFLMDEPLSNLDAQLRVQMRDELAELHGRLGATFVYVTHDQVEAMTMSNRVAMLDGGRLVQIGPPRELYSHPVTLAVARFIGTPTINVLSAEVVDGGRLVLGQRTPLPLATGLCPGRTASLGVRPEHLQLVQPMAGDLDGILRRIEDHGAELLLFVDLEEGLGKVIVRRVAGSPTEPALRAGEAVGVAIDLAATHVFDEAGHRVPISGMPAQPGLARLRATPRDRRAAVS